MTAGPVVLVDDREPPNSADRLRDFGVTAAEVRLDAGDYAFYPHGLTILIERKTMSNLLGSLSDKQMVSQAHKLVDSADMAFVLREGAFRRDPSGSLAYYSPRDPRSDKEGWVESGWAGDSFNGMMLDLQLMGIDFIDCPVLGEYPREIARVVINLSKEEHRWIRERERPEVITIDKQYRNAVWALAAFDGIGVDWAGTLLKELGTYANVILAAAAGSDSLASVKRQSKSGRMVSFGRKKAARLHEEVGQAWNGG